MIFFLTLLLNIELNNLLPSKEIWDNYQEYLKNGIIQDFQKKHFIFDDANNTGFDSDDLEMIDLYEIQESIYKSYGIRSYIFFIKYIDSSLESFGLIRNRTRDNLRNNNYNVDDSIFSVISVDTIDLLIYTGKNTKRDYISNGTALIMKNNIKTDLQNGKYYDSLKNYLLHIQKTCYSHSPYTTTYNYTKPNYTRYYSSNERHSTDVGNIVGPILSGVFVIGAVILCCCCCKKNKGKCCNYPSSGKSVPKNTNLSFSSCGNGVASIGGYSGGGYSGGGNSIGGYSAGGNSFGGYSAGGNSFGGYSGGANSIGGCSGGA